MRYLPLVLFLAGCGQSGYFSLDGIEVGVNGDVIIYAGEDESCGVVVSKDDQDGRVIPLGDNALRYKTFGEARDPGPDYMKIAARQAYGHIYNEEWGKLEVLGRHVTSAICF